MRSRVLGVAGRGGARHQSGMRDRALHQLFNEGLFALNIGSAVIEFSKQVPFQTTVSRYLGGMRCEIVAQ
jgi:hypothetical protein